MHFLTKKILLQNLVTFLSQIFPEKFVTKKWLNSAIKMFFCQKMHFYGITVVIISKICEVMKSETKIVLINYNTHVHALSKKNIFFQILSLPMKIKVGNVSKCQKKAFFWADRNFWPIIWPGTPKIGRMKLFARIDRRGFQFKWKTKKLIWSFKVSQLGILKNRGCPPFLKWNNNLETPLPRMVFCLKKKFFFQFSLEKWG